MSFAIDLLRHLLCLAVISLHMTSPSRYTAETNASLGAFNDYWAVGAVFGFFIISGYLSKDQALSLPFIRQKAFRLLVPYLLFSALYLVVLAALGKAPGTTVASGVVAIATLNSPGMQLYFLPFLFLVTSAFHALQTVVRNRPTLLVLAITLGLGGALCLPTGTCTGPDIRLLPMYFLAFATGCLIKDATSSRRAVPLSCLLLACTFALGSFDVRFLHLGVTLATFLAFHALAGALPERRLPGSGGVYVLHTPITNFCISTALDRLSVHQIPNAILSVILTYALCLGLTLIVVHKAKSIKWVLLE